MEKRHYSSAEQLSSSSVFSDTIIMSRNNPKVKQIRALLKRPERERTGLALVEGLRLVTEALRYPQRVRQLIVAPELLEEPAWTGTFGRSEAKRAPLSLCWHRGLS